ncbi:MAG: hypothetical protein WA101_02140 [Minisyncoccia bacterium]
MKKIVKYFNLVIDFLLIPVDTEIKLYLVHKEISQWTEKVNQLQCEFDTYKKSMHN